MRFLFTVALVYACAAQGCTFCYSTSKFEEDCKTRGGQIRTFAASQTCVLGAGHVAGNVIDKDDDAGN